MNCPYCTNELVYKMEFDDVFTATCENCPIYCSLAFKRGELQDVYFEIPTEDAHWHYVVHVSFEHNTTTIKYQSARMNNFRDCIISNPVLKLDYALKNVTSFNIESKLKTLLAFS